MSQVVDIARVDLGAAHNGRVVRRNIFADAAGRRYIVDHGRRVYLLRFNHSKRAHVNYVIDPKQ